MLQIDGVTPLLIASLNGHVECVRALLGGSAAINQAAVGAACSLALLRGGSGWGRMCGSLRARMCLLGAHGCRALEEGMRER